MILKFDECKQCEKRTRDIYNCIHICNKPLEALKKFNRYKKLEEQGKLLELPCTFGDTVFVKMLSGGYAEAEVKDFSYFHSCGFCVVVTSDNFNKQNIPFSEFGKTVFVTRKEEEETLKENP